MFLNEMTTDLEPASNDLILRSFNRKLKKEIRKNYRLLGVLRDREFHLRRFGRRRRKWSRFWDWLHCKAEELDVLEIGTQEEPLKRFDVQVWLCEMWEQFYHPLEDTLNE